MVASHITSVPWFTIWSHLIDFRMIQLWRTTEPDLAHYLATIIPWPSDYRFNVIHKIAADNILLFYESV